MQKVPREREKKGNLYVSDRVPAWKDAAFSQSLSAEEQALLQANLAGEIQVTKAKPMRSFSQKAGEMQPHTSYLICATPRSGSTLLCEALKNSGLAGRPEEYFQPDNEAFWKELWETSSHADYVARVMKEGTTSNGVFGMKIMWGHVDDFVDKLRAIPGYKSLPVPELLSTIFPHLHYIFMIRSDKVRQAISLEKAIQTNIWGVMNEISPVSKPSIGSQPNILGHHPLAWLYPSPSEAELHFDFAYIQARLRHIESEEAAWEHYFAENGIAPFRVVYEELVEAYEQTAIEILNVLSIPVPGSLQFLSRHIQQQADALSEEWVQRYYEFSHQEEERRANS
jgi:LPS sulfotransferase NodH